jgi:hypothetical protein
MGITKMTCTNIVSQLTNGAKYAGKECGQKAAIGRQRLCSGSECISLEGTMGRDSLMIFTISASSAKTGRLLIFQECLYRHRVTHTFFLLMVTRYFCLEAAQATLDQISISSK